MDYIEIYSEEDEEDFEFPCYWGCPIDDEEIDEEAGNGWYFPTEDDNDDMIGWD